MGVFSKTNASRMADTVAFLTTNRVRIGPTVPVITQISQRATQQGWGTHLSLGGRDDWGGDVSLGRGRLFADSTR